MGQSKPQAPAGVRLHGTCPICSAPGDATYRPFCSRRCADVDLSRWLRGGYAIAGGQQDADEDGDDMRAATGTQPDHTERPDEDV